MPYKVKFDNGYVASFDKEPTQQDIDDAAEHMSQNIKPAPATEQPSGFFDKVGGLINKGVGAVTTAIDYTGAPKLVGGVVGALGAVEGAATGGLGQAAIEAYKGVTGKSEGLGNAIVNIDKAAQENAQRTAEFGYNIGHSGTEAVPFGALGRVPNLVMAAGQGYQGYKDIKQGVETGDTAQALQGGIEAGFAALGAKTALGKGKQGVIFKPGTKEIVSNLKPVKEKIIAKNIDKLESAYEEISAGTKSGKKKLANSNKITELKDRAGTEGRTPQRVLAEQGVIPKQKGSKLDTVDQAEQIRNDSRYLQELNKEALKEVEQQTPPKNFDAWENEAVQMARSQDNIRAGVADDLEAEIRKEFAGLRKNYNSDTISLTEQNLVKSARWGNVKFNKKNPFLSSSDSLKKDSDYIIGKTAQKNIEKTASEAGFEDVAQLNREIGDRLNAADYLQGLDGMTVKGGRLSKYTGMIIGSTFGTSPQGKLLGAIGGNAVADMLISTSVAGPVKRLILKNLEIKDPKAYAQTIKWMEQQGLLRDARLALPAPKSAKQKIQETGTNKLQTGTEKIPLNYRNVDNSGPSQHNYPDKFIETRP